MTAGAISVVSNFFSVEGNTKFTENTAEFGGEAHNTCQYCRRPLPMMNIFRGEHFRTAAGSSCGERWRTDTAAKRFNARRVVCMRYLTRPAVGTASRPSVGEWGMKMKT